MKKIGTLISVLFLGSALSLGACKKDEDKKDEAPAKKADEAKPDETKPADPPKDEAKPADPAAGGGGAAATGLAECDAYVAAVDAYMKCDKVPQSARDAAKQGIDAMKTSWANMGSMPEDAKKAAADACKQGVDALKQGASAMGCTL